MEKNGIDIKISEKQKDVINENNETINKINIKDSGIKDLNILEKSNKKIYLRMLGLAAIAVVIAVIINSVTLATKKDKNDRILNPIGFIDSTLVLTTDLEDQSSTPTNSTEKLSIITFRSSMLFLRKHSLRVFIVFFRDITSGTRTAK